ncbi:tetratricopeptide repeat protein [candidate division KSB1 bacterium]|nr:tetratricopeptide repeat protein [candidate division KSB1 bacterium]
MNMLPIIAFLSFLFIIFYLYKNSEIVNKRKLVVFTALLIVIFIIVNIIYYHRSKPPEQQFRLLICPFSFAGDISPENRALFQYVPYFASNQIYRSVTDKAVVIPFESVHKTFDLDSLSNAAYLSKIVTLTGTTHFVTGEIDKLDTNSFRLHLSMGEPDVEHQAVEFGFQRDEFPQMLPEVSKAVMNFMNIPGKSIFDAPISSSIDHLQHFMAAFQLYLAEQFNEAIEELAKAIAADSTNSAAHLLAAETYYAQAVKEHAKNEKSAIREFSNTRFFLDEAIVRDSLNDENYRLLGEYYIFNERWARAEEALYKAWQLNSNNPRIYPPYARFHEFRYQKIGFQNEEQLYERAIYLNPFYEKAYLLLSSHHVFNNSRDKGMQVLHDYLQLNPESIRAMMALTKIHIVRNEVMPALNLLEKVIKLDPDRADAFYNLGIVYYNTEDFDNAKRFFKRAIEISNHLNSYLYLAYINEKEGDKEQAIAYLRKRIHYKTGFDDEFAEVAREHLYKLIHQDSTKGKQND